MRLDYRRLFVLAVVAANSLDLNAAAAEAKKCQLPCVTVIETSWLPSRWAGRDWPALISGGGDIIVELDSAEFKKTEANKLAKYPVKNADVAVDKKGHAPLLINGPGLIVNGVPLGSDARIVERYENDAVIRLRYRITPSNYSRPLWTTVYKDKRFLEPLKVPLALGWSGEPDLILLRDISLRVSTPPAVTGAFAFLVLLVGFYFWALGFTDIFRIGKIDELWRNASNLRRKLKRRRWLPWLGDKELREQTATAKQLLAAGGNFGELKDFTDAQYRSAANSALSGRVPVTPDDIQATTIGLALFRTDWHLNRRPYSLSRVQIGTWTVFACSVAIFLWIVYGALPDLEPTMFGLLGISTATSMVSYYLEDKTLVNVAGPSEGFMKDILTGWDGNPYVHRFQAVIVNLLLLADGIVYVVQNLGYPVFDGTWLQFLGLSGIAQVAGKALVENQPGPNNAVPSTKVNSDTGGEFKPGPTVD